MHETVDYGGSYCSAQLGEEMMISYLFRVGLHASVLHADRILSHISGGKLYILYILCLFFIQNVYVGLCLRSLYCQCYFYKLL